MGAPGPLQVESVNVLLRSDSEAALGLGHARTLEDAFVTDEDMEWDTEGCVPISSTSSLSGLIQMLQSGNLQDTRTVAIDDLPSDVASLLDNPLMVDLMTLFVETVQEKSQLETSCDTMRQDLASLQNKYAESLEVIQEETREAEEERDETSKVVAQVQRQLIQTKGTLDKDLEAKEEELHRLTQQHSKLQEDFTELSRRLKDQQTIHQQERSEMHNDIENKQTVISRLQQQSALKRRQSENTLTLQLASMVEAKEEEVNDLREELLGLKRQIQDEDDEVDGEAAEDGDDTTANAEESTSPGDEEKPTRPMSRRPSRLSNYFESMGPRRESCAEAEAEPATTEDGVFDVECDLGELKTIVQQQIVKSRDVQMKMLSSRRSLSNLLGRPSCTSATRRRSLSTGPSSSDMRPQRTSELQAAQPSSDIIASDNRTTSNDDTTDGSAAIPSAATATGTATQSWQPSRAGAGVLPMNACAPPPRRHSYGSSRHRGDVAGRSNLEGLQERVDGDGSDRPESTVLSPIRSFNVVLLGNSGSGKTSFCHRIQHGRFQEDLASTVGMDVVVKDVVADSERITIKLWDTAGTEKYRSVAPATIRKADGVMILYDVTCETSFKAVKQWMGDVKEASPHPCPVLIVGNKIDLVSDDDDGDNEHRHFKPEDAAIHGDEPCGVRAISCKTGLNLTETLDALTREMARNEESMLQSARATCRDDGNAKTLSLHGDEAKAEKCNC